MSEVNDDRAALPLRLAREPDSGAEEEVTLPFRSGAPPLPPKGLAPELVHHPRYQVLGLLGEGGMGAVYRAEHRIMKRPVALKAINGRFMDDPTAVERFRREVEAAARLTHPNIVTAYDAERAGDTHFLVMELVDGVTLDRLIARKGALPVAHACDYVRQAALGLHHAHERGMVHRDIKPQNLMLTRKGQIKVLDFGLARFVSENEASGALTENGTVAGTPDYIAPEQAEDAHQADIRADIYSLGCTLYFLLTGQPPFPQGSALQKLLAHQQQTPRLLTAFRDDLPPSLIASFERMTAKDPERRYQTPAEAARALLAIRQEANTLAKSGQAIRKTAPAGNRGSESRGEKSLALAETDPILSSARTSAETAADTKTRSRSRTKRKRTSARRSRTVLVALGLAFGLLLLAGVGGLIALIFLRPGRSPESLRGSVPASAAAPAEVFFRSEVPEAEVIVRRDGQVIQTFRPGPGRQLVLPPGEYHFQLAGEVPGYRLSSNRLVLAPGDHKGVDVQPNGPRPRPNGGPPPRPGFPPPRWGARPGPPPP